VVRLKRKAYFSRSGLIAFFVIVLVIASWAAQTPPSQSSLILAHLNQAISWYHRIAALDITSGQPSDTIYLENARNSAAQALQLAFQSASAHQAFLAQQKKNANADNASDTSQPADQQQNITKALAGTTNRIANIQSQIADLNAQIAKAKSKTRQPLISQRDALQGELDLYKTIQDSLQKIAAVANTESTGSGLAAQIAQLKQSVPEVFAASKKETRAPVVQTSKATAADNAGLFGLTSILFGQMRDMHEVDQLMDETVRLRNTADKLETPLRYSLKSMLQQGQDIVNRPDTTDPAQTAATQRDFAGLTVERIILGLRTWRQSP